MTLPQRFAAGRVARFATANASGAPHVVPVTFAVLADPTRGDDRIVFVIDGKPKTGRPLKRLANIAANPAVSVIVDNYDDTAWSKLWWVRADGKARIAGSIHEREEGLTALREKYPQYRGEVSTDGPLVVVDVERWSGWTAS